MLYRKSANYVDSVVDDKVALIEEVEAEDVDEIAVEGLEEVVIISAAVEQIDSPISPGASSQSTVECDEDDCVDEGAKTSNAVTLCSDDLITEQVTTG